MDSDNERKKKHKKLVSVRNFMGRMARAKKSQAPTRHEFLSDQTTMCAVAVKKILIGFTEVSPLELLCLFTKGRSTDRKPVNADADKTVIDQLG